ncbi:MAG: HAD family phosphatase [Bacteroidota bacterium]|nr:HAD family phosphatase [Bacteroidota bacterium]
MIRNIIFDLGNVLISFIPSEYLRKKNYPEAIRKTILNDIFHSDEWKLLDNGDITVKEAIDSISKKSTLNREEIALVFNFRRDIMFPLDENVRLLPALRKQGFSLYYLSNFPLDVFEEVKSDYFFFRYFRGGVVSSEVKLSKPDIKIFNYILEHFSLNPGESLYIDDVSENVRSAESTGMKVMMTNGSVKIQPELEEVLGIKL